MSLYDRYSDVMKGHPPFVQRLERQRQQRILNWIAPHLPAGPVSAVEIGVGIGLFALAARERGWAYTGIDRNAKMARALGADFTVLEGEVPPLPAALAAGTHQLAYSSFVLEHLADGTAAYHFIAEMKRILEPGGLVALVVPDALSLGIEFWNLDYTHRYPTCDRNVTQILLENELEPVALRRYKGAGWTGLPYHLLRSVAWAYSYRFWSAVTGNRLLPYSLYQYLNQDILVFIARKRGPA